MPNAKSYAAGKPVFDPGLELILEHASAHTVPAVPSSANAVLVLVHPYYPLFERGLSEKREAEEAATILMEIESTKAYYLKRFGDGKDGVQEYLKQLDEQAKHFRNGNSRASYLGRLERTVSKLDPAAAAVILAESAEDYWAHSAMLVQTGRINAVIITKNRQGVVFGGEAKKLESLAARFQTAYVAGAYGTGCVRGVAAKLTKLGVKVVLVKDLIFDFYAAPKTVLAIWQNKGIIRSAEEAIFSYQLPLVVSEK